jgi:hypothetical protein
MRSRRIAGIGKSATVCNNKGSAYDNGCDILTEGHDILALVDLLPVGDDRN